MAEPLRTQASRAGHPFLPPTDSHRLVSGQDGNATTNQQYFVLSGGGWHRTTYLPPPEEQRAQQTQVGEAPGAQPPRQPHRMAARIRHPGTSLLVVLCCLFSSRFLVKVSTSTLSPRSEGEAERCWRGVGWPWDPACWEGPSLTVLGEEETQKVVVQAPGTRQPLPPKQLPVLPLAIDTWRFHRLRRSEKWKECRVAFLRLG